MAGKVKKGLDSAEISSFCSQVALILSAGLPLYDGMETLARTTEGTEYAELYKNASQCVIETGSLYEALKRDERWPGYMVEMTGIGEQTGQLESVMNGLSEYYAREDRIRSSIIGAITYPLVLGVMLVLIITIMLWRVMPVFQRVLNSMGAEMSASGSALIFPPMILLRSAASLSMSYRRTVPHISASMARSVMNPQAHPRDPPPM